MVAVPLMEPSAPTVPLACKRPGTTIPTLALPRPGQVPVTVLFQIAPTSSV